MTASGAAKGCQKLQMLSELFMDQVNHMRMFFLGLEKLEGKAGCGL